MLNLDPKARLLVVAAHADDEAIGCGGLLMAHQGPKYVIIVTNPGEIRDRAKELRLCLFNAAGKGNYAYQTLSFPDQRLDTISQIDCNIEIERVIKVFKPDIILTHSIHDNNLDHQFVHKSVNVAARYIPNLLYFHIPSPGEFVGFNPQVSVRINPMNKIDLLRYYDSEMRDPPHPRSYANLATNTECFEVGRLQFHATPMSEMYVSPKTD